MAGNFAAESFAWGLEAMARLNRIPLASALVRSQTPPHGQVRAGYLCLGDIPAAVVR